MLQLPKFEFKLKYEGSGEEAGSRRSVWFLYNGSLVVQQEKGDPTDIQVKAEIHCYLRQIMLKYNSQ